MISSTSNSQIKNLTLLAKKSKARKEQGVFLVEGLKMFQEAPPEWITNIYVSESFLAEEIHREQLEGYSYEVVTDHVMKAASDTITPQGILCVVKQPKWDLSAIMEEKNTTLLLLEGIRDPGNLGTMVRTGEGAGIHGIVVNKDTADIYNPKTVRSTMGSIYRVPVYVAEDFKETILWLKEQGMKLYAAHLNGELSYHEPDYKGSTGILIGNEAKGLSNEISELSDTYVKIPMEGKVESLNAAIAATLFMYEVNRQRRE